MIQELGERKLYNEFEKKEAEAEDRVFVFDEDRILVRKGSNGRQCLVLFFLKGLICSTFSELKKMVTS